MVLANHWLVIKTFVMVLLNYTNVIRNIIWTQEAKNRNKTQECGSLPKLWQQLECIGETIWTNGIHVLIVIKN